MTRASPRVIFMENHKKKVPYEDRTCWSDRAGKTCAALLKLRTALQENALDKIDAS